MAQLGRSVAVDEVRVCRTCGERFRGRPGKPGYVDECEDCAADRLGSRPVLRFEKVVCRYCGKPVGKLGDVHSSCLQRRDTLSLTRDEFDEFIRLQKKRRWDWPAVFSANEHGDVWPFVRYGYTYKRERTQVRGISRIIDAVAEEYIKTRSEGGRFFIDDNGAFYKDEAAQLIRFLTFKIEDKETIAPHHGL